MTILCGIEVGPDYCVLVGARRVGASIEVIGARVFDAAEWPSDLEPRVTLLQEARDWLGLGRRATVVAWDRPRFNMASGEAMLRQAGFAVEDIVAPPDALALLAWSVPRGRAGRPAAWLSINQHGVAIAVLRDFEQLYAREFFWAIKASERRAQPHLLRRYLYVAQLAPELRRAMDVVRQQYGQRVELAVACGNIPDLRSFTLPLVEELDIEFQILDSLEGLRVDDEVAAAVAQAAPAIRLAAAAAYGQTPVKYGPVLKWLAAAAGVVLAAGTVWGALTVWSASGSGGAGPIKRNISSGDRSGQPIRAADRNPTVESRPSPPEPQPTTGVVVDQPAELRSPLPNVDGILISSDRRLAIIDGAVVGVGDRVGQRVVARIESEVVVFREPSGRLVRVEVRAKARS